MTTSRVARCPELCELLADMPNDHYHALQDALGRRKYLVDRPDLTIAPDGKPYLYRWYIRRLPSSFSLYIHLQVADDPLRLPHDHPWDNTTHVLAGGYNEYLQQIPPYGDVQVLPRRAGETVHRKAEWAHRLVLAAEHPYCLTAFSTGAVRRRWGFWYPDGWHDSERHVRDSNGKSVHIFVEDRDHDA